VTSPPLPSGLAGPRSLTHTPERKPDRGRTARTRAGSAIHASARRRAASGIAAADRADAAERHAER
ncbi:hypothetical protein, partial [Ralstonia pseudosolanacearum]|uniref:hypothetical protein n=1 Tax=Ralstonia pseudosolanacearum TaxID=1310165 RepID=UPI003D183B6F